MTALLEVEGLTTQFPGARGALSIVDGNDLRVERGEVLALVGESGCGKSMTALSLMRLVPKPGRIVAGQVRLEGRDLLELSVTEMRRVRGRRIAMIFQEPMTSLNPVIPVGDQVIEAIRLHESISRSEAKKRCRDLFVEVGIPDPEERLDAYPHQLSGGLKQRVMIAMALSTRPDLLIADEPTTALDVTIQAQIIRLLRDIQRDRGMSILLITHDLGIVNELSDRVAVMYAGRIVETGSRSQIFREPAHPYTRGLLRSNPTLAQPGQRLPEIAGVVPSPEEWGAGCRFATRCGDRFDLCDREVPDLLEIGDHRRTACHAIESGSARGGQS
ncbi:MAG: ABC transporter ATP-binding protein [Myxococcota bacterium]|jgi:peptide/nickel transport system ATP-binding protein|nr:ABC transporter ATP-binding protein [Myxococcota bacterium]